MRSAAAGGISGAGLAVLFAFLGGAILNLMPCVFPVLALKALAFAKKAEHGHWQQGIAYLGGVLISFGVFAALIVAFREGSAALGLGLSVPVARLRARAGDPVFLSWASAFPAS